MKLANFEHRLLAFYLDLIIFLMIIAEMYLLIVSQPNISQAFLYLIISIIILLNPILIFYAVWTTHYFGGSPGKLLTGLQVVSQTGEKLSFPRILFRQTIGYSFSGIFFGLGYLVPIKDSKRQTWHDKAIGSYVIQSQNLTLLGLLTALILTVLTTYFFISATQILMNGSILNEIQQLIPQN